MRRLDAAAPDLRGLVRSNDGVVFGEGTAEPQTLTEALAAQRADIGRLRVFLGLSFTQTFAPGHADFIDFVGLGGFGTNRRLARAGCLDVIPCHMSQVPSLIREGRIPCDVVLVQVSPPNERGEYSLALANDFLRAAIGKARVVIAEVNANAPQASCEEPLREDEIDAFVETDRPLLQWPAARGGELERRIAAHVDPYIADRATLQVGLGSIPEAIMKLLGARRDLGIHSGMIGDSVVDLIESGAVTNAHKGVDEGLCVTGLLIGTDRLYRFAHRNPAIRLCQIAHTHGEGLGRVRRLVSINSALEVDLTGQVNAESLGAEHVGAVGGQVDFVRAAARCADGISIIALPAATKGGVSRIVARLSGPVTTARSDVDVIATEHGAVRLRGLPLRARIEAMISIAAPEHREALRRQAAQSAA